MTMPGVFVQAGVLVYQPNVLRTQIVSDLRTLAMKGYFTGDEKSYFDYMMLCRAQQIRDNVVSSLIFTRDVGMHTGGWFKNPDYERCWHLTISYKDFMSSETIKAEFARKLTVEWLTLFFGEERRKLWTEPPAFEKGKQHDVWHYRLFCDENWVPLKPRKEVYTREFTEQGWMSYSDLKYEEQEVFRRDQAL